MGLKVLLMDNIDDALKIVIVLINDLELGEHAYLEQENSVIIVGEDHHLSIFSMGTVLNLYLIKGSIDFSSDTTNIKECIEIDFYDPQSINILKEWIGKVDINGRDRHFTRPSV